MNTPPDTSAPRAASLFQQTLDVWNAVSPLRISFDDITGVTLDYPQLLLPVEYEIHTCATCLHAKLSPTGRHDCYLNKIAANALALRRREGFGGLCHLGLFDLVEPLVVNSYVLGVFYYGSVTIEERAEESRRRILRYCARKALSAEAHLAAWERAPRIREADIPAHQARLRTLAQSTRLWCEALAIPVERYPLLQWNIYWERHRHMPFLVRASLKYAAMRFGQSCRVADIAAHLRCNANYLSGEFKRHMGVNLADHVQHVRIDRAKALLRAKQLAIGEVGFRCGFADTSHFIRTFKKATGQTPKAYQAVANAT